MSCTSTKSNTNESECETSVWTIMVQVEILCNLLIVVLITGKVTILEYQMVAKLGLCDSPLAGGSNKPLSYGVV